LSETGRTVGLIGRFLNGKRQLQGKNRAAAGQTEPALEA